MNAEMIVLPDSLRSALESELRSGERITWLDQPLPNLMARKGLPIVFFGIVWTTLLVGGQFFWYWQTGSPEFRSIRIVSMLGAVPFVAVGLAMMSSPYWMRRSALNTVYALTDHRAIVISSNWRGVLTVRSFESGQLNVLKRSQNADGSGDVVVAQDARRDGDGDIQTTDVGFLAVSDVKDVEDRVRALAQKDRE